ncbi:cytochrome b-c1 complex subunit 7, partial [Cynara cardunculus var. scolymus]
HKKRRDISIKSTSSARDRRPEIRIETRSSFRDRKFHIISMSNSQFLKTILDPKKNWFAALHKKTLAHRLSLMGLRYDDLFDPMESLDIKEALNRLPREIVDARNQRILRAMDLSMKHEYLPKDLQVKRERAEREALGALPLEQRTMP